MGPRMADSARLSTVSALAAMGAPVFPLHGLTKDGSCTCGDGACKRPRNHPRTPNGVADAKGVNETYARPLVMAEVSTVRPI
jgi:hypothetical protein